MSNPGRADGRTCNKVTITHGPCRSAGEGEGASQNVRRGRRCLSRAFFTLELSVPSTTSLRQLSPKREGLLHLATPSLAHYEAYSVGCRSLIHLHVDFSRTGNPCDQR